MLADFITIGNNVAILLAALFWFRRNILKIGTENFTNKRLGELYLVGYADQMMDFKAENAEYKAKAKKQEE